MFFKMAILLLNTVFFASTDDGKLIISIFLHFFSYSFRSYLYCVQNLCQKGLESGQTSRRLVRISRVLYRQSKIESR